MKSRKIFSKKDANQTKRATAISPLLSPPLQQQPRRKGTSTKPWIVVSDSGESHVEVIGKHSIMRRTGLPARDLRILDPALSYPSTVLGRERAIVVNLEHIKAIITATEALVLDSNSPLVASLVEDLQYNASNFQRMPRQVAECSDNEIGKTDKAPLVSHSILSNHDSAWSYSMGISEQSPIPLGNSSMIPEMKDSRPMPTLEIPKNGVSKVLPFEFRMLEVCLESACKCLESETFMLEKEAYPALDELTSRISTLNLERVRQIKSRLVVISGRVQKVRDELEHLLDDDMDMAEMYLSDKLAHQQLEETSSRDELDDDAFEMDNESGKDSESKVKSYYGSLSGFKPNIEDLEMLLEAYFTQIEGTLSKLSTLREYVDDTEDYINIMLDDKQNQLLQMGVMISTATLVLTGGIVVMGVLGMNIRIPLFKTSQTQFLETTFGTVGGCIVLYIIAIGFAKKRGLLA